MSSVDNLLSRLTRVKKAGIGKWIASCPTRDDKSPSLAIRELEDGTILLHDFGGDSVEAVLGAVGLSFTDLYPEKPRAIGRPVRRPFNAADVLSLMAFESTVAVVVCSDFINNRKIADGDFARLLVAAQRLADAAEVCNGSR